MYTKQQEEVLLSEGNVHITNVRAVIGPKTYAMSNITSVTTARNDPSGRIPLTLILCGAVMILGFGLSLLSLVLAPAGNAREPFWSLLIFGIIALGLGFPIHRGLKPTFMVRIGSASGEADVLASVDRAFIERIVDAVNQAIVSRG